MEALIALLLSAILGALGLSGKAERRMEAQLRQSLGRVEQVKVDIHRGHRSPFSRQVDRVEITVVGFRTRSLPTGGLRIGGGGDLVGKVGMVAIHARNFHINDLPVARLDITIKDLRYDLWKAIWRRELEVIRVGDSRAQASLTAEAVARMVAPRIKQLENPQITFSRDRLTLTGYRRFGVRVPVRLTFGLAAVRSGRIYVVEPQARVWVAPVPSFIISRLTREINPIVDLNQGKEGPFKLEIDKIRVTPGSLRVYATLKPRKQG